MCAVLDPHSGHSLDVISLGPPRLSPHLGSSEVSEEVSGCVMQLLPCPAAMVTAMEGRGGVVTGGQVLTGSVRTIESGQL